MLCGFGKLQENLKKDEEFGDGGHQGRDADSAGGGRTFGPAGLKHGASGWDARRRRRLGENPKGD